MAPCTLLGDTTLGENCQIEPGTFIRNSKIANDVKNELKSFLEDVSKNELFKSGLNIFTFNKKHIIIIHT